MANESFILNQLNSIFESFEMGDDPIPVIDQIDEYIEDILLSCLNDHERIEVDPVFKKAFDECPHYGEEDDDKMFDLLQEYYYEKNISHGNQGRISIEDYKKYKRNLNR